MNPSEEKEEQLFDKMFNTPGHYDLIGSKKQLTKEDYLKILQNKKSSQGANYADSMVFYKGKVLGRCPSGTIRSGKTCVPGAPAKAKGPGYKTQDLGGLTPAQVKALSKAKSTEDIIEAHRKEEQND
jgi:hypothetical protein